MRLLIALLLAGCYHAPVEDCQFTCNTGTECPSGLSCVGRFCQAGPTNVCTQSTDAAIDTPIDMPIDVPIDAFACPGAPAPPSECGTAFPFTTGGCGVLCTETQRSWSEARDRCSAVGWRLGVLSVPQRLTEIPNSTERFWVGAQLATTWQWLDGSAVAMAAWDGGIEPVTGNPCALFDGQKQRLVNDTDCGQGERYVCTFAP